MSDVAAVAALFSGDRHVVCPRAYIDITQDFKSAFLLNQVVFYSATPTARKRHGWFYKSWRHWQDEIGLSRRESECATKKLEERGLIKTKVRKAGNAPTRWYCLNQDAFAAEVHQLLDIPEPQGEEFQEDSPIAQNVQSGPENHDPIAQNVQSRNAQNVQSIPDLDHMIKEEKDATPPPAGGVAEAPPASAPEDDIPLEIDTSPPAVVRDEAPAPKVDISVHPWEAEVTRQQREDREVDVLIERLAPDRRAALEALARNRVSQQAGGRRDFVTSGAVRAEMRRLVVLARARKSAAQAETPPPVHNGNGTALRVTLRWCRVCQEARPAREVPAGLACETCHTLFDPQEATP